MTRNTDHLTWVLEWMPDESAAALARFTAINPQYVGANWDDCLDILLDADAHLDVTEPLYDDDMLRAQGQLTSAAAVTLVYADMSFLHLSKPERRGLVLAVLERES